MGLAWSRLPPAQKAAYTLVAAVAIISIVFAVVNTISKKNDNKKKGKNKKFDDKRLDDLLDEQTKTNIENSNEMGLDDPTEAIAQEAKCFMPQYIPGKCIAGYKPSVDTPGCCDPKNSEGPDQTIEGLKTAAEISKNLMISLAFDALVVDRLTKWGNNLIRKSKTVSTAARGATAAKGAVKSSIQAGRAAKTTTKAGVQIASKASTKVGTAAAKRGAMAAMGPVGWAVLAAEITLGVLDFIDPFGYNSFKSNVMNMNSRKVMDYLMQKKIEDAGGKYPLLITGVALWPDVFQIAASNLMPIISTKIDQELTTDEEYINGAEAVDIGDFMEFYSDYIGRKMEEYLENEENKKEMDKILYDNMITELGNISPEFKGDIQYNEDVYTSHGTGIIATRQGVNRWNNRYKDKWEINEASDELVGLYTNEYLVADKLHEDFTADEPVMKTEKLEYYLPIFTIHSSIISSCLSKITVKNGPDINPVSLGVTYDYDKGVCNYPKRYCDRYGLMHTTVTDEQTGIRFTNCKMYPGQEVGEAILGTTATRALNQADQAIYDFFDPPRKPKECLVPRDDSVEGICNTPDDCKEIGEDLTCLKEYGSEIRDGRCVSSSTIPYIGATCTSREGSIYSDYKCESGTFCDLGEDDRPDWGRCRFGFSEAYGEIPHAICLGSREVFKYSPYNQILEQDDTPELDIIQTGCYKKSRFDYDNLGTKDRCPDGYIDIDYERSNCALGSRRAYCVKEDQEDAIGGYKLFNQDEVEIRSK